MLPRVQNQFDNPALGLWLDCGGGGPDKKSKTGALKITSRVHDELLHCLQHKRNGMRTKLTLNLIFAFVLKLWD